jgi:hypothetical protein
MAPSTEDIARRIDALVDEQRAMCLWFLRSDYYPRTDAERVRVLGDIQRHGGLRAFKTAAELKQWLSPTSNAGSAGS